MTICTNSCRRSGITGRCALLVAGMLAAVTILDRPVLANDSDSAVGKISQFSVRNIRKHQKKFQRIADRNDGTRAAGTPGYDESADYVNRKLEKAGYDAELQEFEFIAFTQLTPSTLEQTAPGSVIYEENIDYALMDQTDAGDVTGTVTGVDLSLTDPEASTSGCEPEDFSGLPCGQYRADAAWCLQLSG